MGEVDIAALQARVDRLEEVAGLASQALVYVWGIRERVIADIYADG